MVTAVTFSSEDTVKAIGVPCAVVPVHWPVVSDELVEDGSVELLHAHAQAHATIATNRITRLLSSRPL